MKNEKMNCKNCKEYISTNNKYCSTCGAEIVIERISTRSLWKGFATNFFGWDNKYFKTLKKLIVQPELVLDGYLQGVRKMYVSPFTFVAIGTAFSLLIFTELKDEYLELSTSYDKQHIELVNEVKDSPKKGENQELLEANVAFQENMIKHMNVLTFLLIPVYTLLAFWVFGKPYNYGEHLIINCYIQGVTFLITGISLIAAVYINPLLYSFMMIGSILYYSYAYKRLYNHNIRKTILKFLKFLGLLISVFIFIIMIGFLYSKIG